MPRLLLAAACAAILGLAFTAAPASAECPVGQSCEPNPTYKTPTTSITSGPGDPTGDVTPDFTFASDLSLVRYECRWGADNQAWNDGDKFACPKNYTSPAKQNGTYYLYVRACKDYIDSEIGDITKCDATPAKYGFVLQATPPEVTFAATSTFDNLRTNKAPKYDLLGGHRYECSIDSEQLFACTTPFQINGSGGLGQGEHIVRVRAIDEAGNKGAVKSRRFTWDSMGPDFTLGGPTLTSDRTPELTWSAPPDGGGSYDVTCKIDDTAIPCADGKAQVTTDLADGNHTFRVAGTDSLGNASSTSRGVEIDTVAPEVRDLAWNAQTRSLSFTTSEPARTFCDDAACSSPWTPEALPPGEHELVVRAVDFADNVGTATITVTIPEPQKEPDQQPPPPPGGGGQQQPPQPQPQPPGPPASGQTAPVPSTPRTTASSTTTKKKVVAKKKAAKKTCKTVKSKKGKKKKVCTTKKAQTKAKRKKK